jgi:hypothetical protein
MWERFLAAVSSLFAKEYRKNKVLKRKEHESN